MTAAKPRKRATKRRGPGRPPGPTGTAKEHVVKLRADDATVAQIDALALPGETRSDVLRAAIEALAAARGR